MQWLKMNFFTKVKRVFSRPVFPFSSLL